MAQPYAPLAEPNRMVSNSGLYELNPLPNATGFSTPDQPYTAESTAFNTPRPSASWTRKLDEEAGQGELPNSQSSGLKAVPHFLKQNEASGHSTPNSYKELNKAEADRFIVKLRGSSDPLDSHNMSIGVRMLVCFSVAFNALLVSAVGSAYLFITPALEVEFGCHPLVAATGFVVYVIGWGPGPLLWAPLSDTIGRKPVYIASAFLWTLFNIGCARAENIWTMIICRFFAGFFGCACLTNGGGTNTDIWQGLAVARAIALYSAVVFLGPVVGPIIGGAIQTYAVKAGAAPTDGGWRWLFYAGIISGVFSTALYTIVPETSNSIRLRSRVKEMQRQDPDNAHLYVTEADRKGLPLTTKIAAVAGSAIKMLGSEPIIIFVSLWQTTAMAIIYLFFEAFPIVFGTRQGFTAFTVGLTFIGTGVGMLAACLWSLTVDLRMWLGRVEKAGDRNPELRLPQGLMGAILTAIGLFWFGYTSFDSIHWIVPVIGSAVYGFGALSVMLSTFAYIVDTYLLRAAPAFAAIGLIRSVATGVLPLGGTYFYRNLGPRNATLILACIAVAEIAIPVLAMRYGGALRSRSKFAMKTA